MERTQDLIRTLSGNVIIIGDEVHNLGAEKIRKCLPENIPFRVGLSATPERWHDKEGTEELYRYFGSLIKPIYGIAEAIRDGHLCRYYYYPHLIELTNVEAEEYHALSKRISSLSSFMSVDDDSYGEDNVLKKLLIKRARLLGKCKNKLNKIRDLAKELVEKNEESKFNLFYCGDGKIEDERQIELVCKILGNEVGLNIDRFTAAENLKKRQQILGRFKEGSLDGLVAIKCLDEGVDIPDIKRAYILASSTNPRQFIQRRGRVLRTSKHDKNKIAEIHDFIVIPHDIEHIKQQDVEVFNVERRLLKRELERFSEFTKTAENGPAAELKLRNIKKIYNLLDT